MSRAVRRSAALSATYEPARLCQVAAADSPAGGRERAFRRQVGSFRSWLGRTGGGRGWRVHGPPRYGAGIARGRRLC
jgi:hypothetical protein